ncbi:sulfotransferase family protein [Ectothiorhodospira marina]|uniref:Sulfotransferase family protein n=1 Tax=Ectothiorhodospira marina TaxID=1396821 RepID=A0A1H7H234_9GAMM|nr:sulfotransferase family protein [Ectothiorhodospira marina]SEK44371.1 Sulfotransferase family protein [Ectothiorhodospira marina]
MTDWFKTLRIRSRPFYRRFKGTPLHVLPQVDQRIAVDRGRGFIYFRIPKAANSTVIRLLTREGDGEYCFFASKRSFARPSDLSVKEVEELDRRFFLFTITRDPYSRILSAYLDKIVTGKRKEKARRALNKSADEDISFEEFCRYLAQGGFTQDPHWYPQDWYIPCDTALLDHVGKMETLTKELETIMARIDPARKLADTGSQRGHRTDARQKLTAYYSQNTAQIIARIYQQDFERFNYPLQPEWLKDIR